LCLQLSSISESHLLLLQRVAGCSVKTPIYHEMFYIMYPIYWIYSNVSFS
jgi:hypothetical protein